MTVCPLSVESKEDYVTEKKSDQVSARPRNKWAGSLKRFLLAGVLLTCFCPLAMVPNVPAQTMPAKRYMNDGVILLPILIDPRFHNEIKEVQLYFKESPASPWTSGGSVPPTQKEFVFQAKKDGEYWFTLVTVNKAGQPSVTNIANQLPQAIVVLDREQPRVELTCLGTTPQGQCVKCQIIDSLPDNALTRLEFQTQDKSWRAMESVVGSSDTYCIPAAAAITGMVKVTAVDRCGNKTQKMVHLQDCEGSSKTSAKPVEQNPLPIPQIPEPVLAQFGSNLQINDKGSGKKQTDGATSNVKSLEGPILNPPSVIPEIPSTPLVQAKTGSDPVAKPPVLNQVAFSNPAQVKSQIVPVIKEILNQPRLALNYQFEEVGMSGVGKVEVWVTKDFAQNWKRLAEDADKKSPIELALPGEGVFGLLVVATNGLGFGGDPPVMGTQPDWWVEVDTTPPQAQLHSVEPIKTGKPGSMLVTWAASDKNLIEGAIDLFYAVESSGPWHPLAKSLKNTGQYCWQVPTMTASRVYVRLTATDRAGNVSITQTPQPVQIDDLSRPKVRIQGIDTSVSAPTTGPSVGK